MFDTTMPVVEVIPKFGGDFDAFMRYLNDDNTPATMSPARFAQLMSLELQTLANLAHVHRNTLRGAPESESVQGFLRDALRVIRAAFDLVDSVEDALYWFKNYPLPVFDYKSSLDLVSEKRTTALIAYIQSLQAGFTG